MTMGLFRRKLDVIEKLVQGKRIEDAYAVLDEHFNDEHTLEGDLAGLAAAIHTYQQQLVDLKGKFAILKHGSTRAPKIIEEITGTIAIAKKEVVKIQAIIGKMRAEAKIKLP